RQQLLRLVVDQVLVAGWQVEIHLRIPLGDDPDPGGGGTKPRGRGPVHGGTPPATPARKQPKGRTPTTVSRKDDLRSVRDDDLGVVEEPVEHGRGGGVLWEESSPFLERPVAGDAQ